MWFRRNRAKIFSSFTSNVSLASEEFCILKYLVFAGRKLSGIRLRLFCPWWPLHWRGDTLRCTMANSGMISCHLVADNCTHTVGISLVPPRLPITWRPAVSLCFMPDSDGAILDRQLHAILSWFGVIRAFKWYSQEATGAGCRQIAVGNEESGLPNVTKASLMCYWKTGLRFRREDWAGSFRAESSVYSQGFILENLGLKIFSDSVSWLMQFRRFLWVNVGRYIMTKITYGIRADIELIAFVFLPGQGLFCDHNKWPLLVSLCFW